MDPSVLAHVLEFVCNHECYETFHELCAESNITECIDSNLALFVLFHITKIKYFFHSHSTNPDANYLSDNLDDLLQSLCYLIPSHQPSKLYTNIHASNSNQSATTPPQSTLFETGYSSTFYRLHQELKIIAILTCTKSITVKVSLINMHLKLNPDTFNFRHLDITQDIAQNGDIHFDIISVIGTLGEIVRKNSKNLEKLQLFHQQHTFQSLKEMMVQFLSEIKDIYCGAMSNAIYRVSCALSRKSKEEALKYRGIDRAQWISKMKWYSAPKPMENGVENVDKNGDKAVNADSECNTNANPRDQTKSDFDSKSESKSKSESESKSESKPKPKPKPKSNPEPTDFKKGMRVRVRRKVKGSSPAEYEWNEGVVIKGNKRMITVEIGTVHVRVRDFSKIEIMEEMDGKTENDGDSDVEMIENVDDGARRKSTRKTSQTNKVQSAKYQRGRRRFEQQEDDALRAGIVKYRHLLHNTKKGEKGIWYSIKNDEQFMERLKHRTPAMLCDRYRVYVNNDNVP